MCKKHEWKLVNQFETKSEFEIVSESRRTPNSHNSMIKKYITDYTCTNCGKLKRFKETN
jgi:ribosomal protein L44E